MDKTLVCADCAGEFVFTASEQAFFAEKGFTEPRRCQPCRRARKAARGDSPSGSGYSSSSTGGYSSDSWGDPRPAREMFSAVCSECGRQASVPFRPTAGKPVFCSDCFRAR
jgi:CxxC-x17-CxxC domain-containing protein